MQDHARFLQFMQNAYGNGLVVYTGERSPPQGELNVQFFTPTKSSHLALNGHTLMPKKIIAACNRKLL